MTDKHINNSVEVSQKSEPVAKPVIQEPVDIQKPVSQPVQQPKNQSAPEQIRVFCGSPKQRTWKTPNMENVALGEQLAKERGWTGGEWNALLELWSCESSWTTTVGNFQGSGAYGIPQSLPASKMASHGSDYLTNPRVQIAWGLDYITQRYGTPAKALAFHYQNNWY